LSLWWWLWWLLWDEGQFDGVEVIVACAAFGELELEVD